MAEHHEEDPSPSEDRGPGRRDATGQSVPPPRPDAPANVPTEGSRRLTSRTLPGELFREQLPHHQVSSEASFRTPPEGLFPEVRPGQEVARGNPTRVRADRDAEGSTVSPIVGAQGLLDGRLEADDAEVLAAIPAYNEEVSIASVVLQTREHVDDVLVIDDGSDDRTAEMAAEAGATVLRFEENQGKGKVVQTAFRRAREDGYDALVLLDGDGQHLPGQIPDLLDPVLGRGPYEEAPVDMTIGLRFGDNTEMPLYRRLGKRVLDYATAAATGAPDQPTDSQTGFRAFNADAIEAMAEHLQADGFGVESEQLMVASDHGLETAPVTITCRYEGLDTSTSDPVRHALSVLNHLVEMVTMRRPLLTMGIPGVILTVAGGGLGIYMLQHWRWTGYFSLPQAIGAGVLILLGLLALMSSLILNMMARVERRLLDEESRTSEMGPR